MPTDKQLTANRANAQKSTGPRTTSGKAASRYHAVKHGIFSRTQIMFDEKADDLTDLAAEYHDHYHPATPEERFLVDTLIHNEWRLRRMRRVEAELWDVATNFFLAENAEATTCSSGDAFSRGESTFDRLQRMVNACERNYHRAARELRRLQAERAQSEPAEVPEPIEVEPENHPQPQDSKSASDSLASFRKNPQPSPSATPQTRSDPPESQPSTPNLPQIA
jgi:hypothetical protein